MQRAGRIGYADGAESCEPENLPIDWEFLPIARDLTGRHRAILAKLPSTDLVRDLLRAFA